MVSSVFDIVVLCYGISYGITVSVKNHGGAIILTERLEKIEYYIGQICFYCIDTNSVGTKWKHENLCIDIFSIVLCFVTRWAMTFDV